MISHFTAISNQDFTEFSNARLTSAYSLPVSCVALPITVIAVSYKDKVRNLGIKLCSATWIHSLLGWTGYLTCQGLPPLLLNDDYYLPYSVITKIKQGNVWYILAQRVCNTQQHYFYSRGSQLFPDIAVWALEYWLPTLAIILLSILNKEVNRNQGALVKKSLSQVGIKKWKKIIF